MFFISTAFADAGNTQSGGIMAFLPMVAFIVILYFLLIRPQQKRQKQHQELIASIKKGDKVVTNSGIIATVSKVVSEHEVILEIANGVHCKFVKSAISNIMENSGKVDTPKKDEEPIAVSNVKVGDSPIITDLAKPGKKTATKRLTSKKAAHKE